MTRDIILIPTYNERKNIERLVPEIFSLLPAVYIQVIDDNSPDGTGDLVEKLSRQFKNLSLLRRQAKEGLGAAYRDAISRLAGDKEIRSITTMDADGSHQVKYLPDLIRLTEKYDLVVGSRYVAGGGVENWEPWRLWLSRYGNLYSRLLTGLPIRDLTAGFVCFRRTLIEPLDFSLMSSAGYAYQIEFKYYCLRKLGALYFELPIIFKERREGESKISDQIISEGLKTPLKIFLGRLWKR